MAKKKRQDADGGMALNKFSFLVPHVGTSGGMANIAKCFSFIPVAGS